MWRTIPRRGRLLGERAGMIPRREWLLGGILGENVENDS